MPPPTKRGPKMTQTAPRNIPKAYDPKAAEARIYKLWMDGGYFTPTIDRNREPFRHHHAAA